mgnify:CR=1 FL=1
MTGRHFRTAALPNDLPRGTRINADAWGKGPGPHSAHPSKLMITMLKCNCRCCSHVVDVEQCLLQESEGACHVRRGHGGSLKARDTSSGD